MKTIQLAVAMLLGVGIATAHSAPAPAGRPVVNETLTMDQAVAIALRESPIVRGAVAEVDAAAARVQAAQAERKPMVSANGFLTTGNNAAILPSSPVVAPQAFMGVPRDTFTDLNLMLMYPLYEGGRLRAMVRSAAAMRDASQSELAGMRQDVVLTTRTAYNAVIARRALVDVWQARLKEDEERLRNDRSRLAQEQVPAYYIKRDEAEVAATRQELTNAQRDVDVALVQLKTAMGVSPESRIDVTGALSEPNMDALLAQVAGEGSAADPLPALLARAERDRPELAAATRRVDGARAETEAARGAFRPQLNATAMGDLMKMQGEGSRTGNTLGVVVSVPLYSGGMRQARVAESEAERHRQEADRERTILRVDEEVQTALLDLRAARQNVDTARTGLTAAREEYSAARLRYQVGRSTVVEALDALTAQVRAESSVVQALYSYNIARDQMLRAVGAMDTSSAIPR